MNDLTGGCTSELDSGADRKSVAAQGDAQPRCQPFDSAPVTTAGPVPAADGIDWPTSGAGSVRQVSSHKSVTLTDAELKAIEWFACYGVDRPLGHSTTLRSLLERTK